MTFCTDLCQRWRWRENKRKWVSENYPQGRVCKTKEVSIPRHKKKHNSNHISPPRNTTVLFPLPVIIPWGAIVYPAREEGGGQERKGNRVDQLMAVNVSICWASLRVSSKCVCVCGDGSFFSFFKHLLSLRPVCFPSRWSVYLQDFI